jgi:hypothetical protein
MRGLIDGWVGRVLLCVLLLAAAAGCQKAEMPVESAPPDDVSPAAGSPPPPPPPPPAPAPEPEPEPAPARPPLAPPSANGGSRPAASALPDFPWPPPRYSAFEVLARDWLVPAADARLGAAAQRLEAAFDAAGYVERSYYRVPGGFALASRAEQIHADASPFPAPERWSVDPEGAGRSFAARLRALFNAPPGHYRVIVFVVTDQDFAAAPRTAPEAEARAWVSGGGLRLPPAIAAQPFTPTHYASALIYEFERRSEREPADVRVPSAAPGRVHLEKGGLWQALAAN